MSRWRMRVEAEPSLSQILFPNSEYYYMENIPPLETLVLVGICCFSVAPKFECYWVGVLVLQPIIV